MRRFPTDIDECTDMSNDCDPNASCANSPGNFTCTCNSGYTGNGTSCTGTFVTSVVEGGCSISTST